MICFLPLVCLGSEYNLTKPDDERAWHIWAELPDWLVVEVPATVDKNGIHGIPMGQLSKGFLGLLRNQVAVHDLTAEAILHQSREIALQALLVDPIVTRYRGIEAMLDTMIDYQRDWLGYLQ